MATNQRTQLYHYIYRCYTQLTLISTPVVPDAVYAVNLVKAYTLHFTTLTTFNGPGISHSLHQHSRRSLPTTVISSFFLHL
ncbi:hypothetical protein SCLCIDRAFT_1212082 [Scleroderma citrinum Foug A]|uniref:Uncharacterized protein n=1 Tax=Scleroderma citrinum Foug A TaxID=1036808 RepID=A0A0C3DYS0_9AGAM|nr:hypothetical protein SCLCIDRAFT_1212082 [Scleroderma citrinum Foug A]